MNKEELNRLLDSIYELEGLVYLAISRDDCPESLPTLIKRKADEMARLASLKADELAGYEKSDMLAGEEKSDEPDQEEYPSVVSVGMKPAEPRGKLVFTINDRYRFKRDLFGGSDADFNTTLALVASMDNYEEAEDYFLNELQWSLQNQETVDFLEILKKYFKD